MLKPFAVDRLRDGDPAAARPCRRRVVGRDRQRAQLAVAIDDGAPHRLAVVQSAGVAVLGGRVLQQCLQSCGGGHVVAASRPWRCRGGLRPRFVTGGRRRLAARCGDDHEQHPGSDQGARASGRLRVAGANWRAPGESWHVYVRFVLCASQRIKQARRSPSYWYLHASCRRPSRTSIYLASDWPDEPGRVVQLDLRSLTSRRRGVAGACA